ncbi:MAG: hypothetical protein AAF911_05645 [Planctomycetota bacterium]
MRTRYDLSAAEERPVDLGNDFQIHAARPASLRAKVFCGLLAGVIVMTVSMAFGRSYDAAEAAGAAQIRIADAEAEVRRTDDKPMRGASGMASAKHDWVFDH